MLEGGMRMSIEVIHLRKLLQLLYSNPRQQETLLRTEVRNDILKSQGGTVAGGDFYAPFWSDVRSHVFNVEDLHATVEKRIENNDRRALLYPILRDGFLKWWEESRRWTNTPFEQVRSPSVSYRFNELLTVKIEGMLGVRDALGIERYIYPYFSEAPALKNEGARISFWLLTRAFPAISVDGFRILDVSRGRIYSPDWCYLEGDEETTLQRKFYQLWTKFVSIEENYGTKS